MNLLALEQSAGTAGIAWFRDGQCQADISWPRRPEDRQRLPPALETFFHEQTLTPDTVDLYLVDVGPGSFAGIRDALSLALGLALPDDRPVQGLCSAEIMAWPWLDRARRIVVVGDARRGQLWTATITGTRAHPRLETAPHLIALTDLPTAVADADADLLISPDTDRLAGRLATLRNHNLQVPDTACHPSARDLGALACTHLANGTPLSPPLPLYLHPAAFLPPPPTTAPAERPTP